MQTTESDENFTYPLLALIVFDSSAILLIASYAFSFISEEKEMLQTAMILIAA